MEQPKTKKKTKRKAKKKEPKIYHFSINVPRVWR